MPEELFPCKSRKFHLRFPIKLGLRHVRPQGRAMGALAPPPPLAGQKIVCFWTFLGKIVSLSLFFRQKIGSCLPPPGRCLRSPGQEVADGEGGGGGWVGG